MFPFRRACICTARRCYTTPASRAYFEATDPRHAASRTTPQDLSTHQRHLLDSALRVDQAGELAADAIYRGQLAVLGRDPATGPLIQACSFVLQ